MSIPDLSWCLDRVGPGLRLLWAGARRLAVQSPGPGGLSPAGPSPQGLPHPLRGLIVYQFGLPWWLVLVLLGLLLGLGSWLAWRWWQRRRNRGGGKGLSPGQEDPLVQLQRQIQALQPPEPFEGKNRAEYFFQLTMLLRQVIELTCHFPATDLTVKELKLPLRSHLPLPAPEVEQLLGFCERAELIKFADAPTDLEEAQLCHGKVKHWTQGLVTRSLRPAAAAGEAVKATT